MKNVFALCNVHFYITGGGDKSTQMQFECWTRLLLQGPPPGYLLTRWSKIYYPEAIISFTKLRTLPPVTACAMCKALACLFRKDKYHYKVLETKSEPLLNLMFIIMITLFQLTVYLAKLAPHTTHLSSAAAVARRESHSH